MQANTSFTGTRITLVSGMFGYGNFLCSLVSRVTILRVQQQLTFNLPLLISYVQVFHYFSQLMKDNMLVLLNHDQLTLNAKFQMSLHCGKGLQHSYFVYYRVQSVQTHQVTEIVFQAKDSCYYCTCIFHTYSVSHCYFGMCHSTQHTTRVALSI